MNRAPLLALAAALSLPLPGCAPAPQAQPVEVWTGQAQVLLTTQRYRLTYTVNPGTYELKGTLENLTSRDRFVVEGTSLPAEGGAEVSMIVTAQDGLRLNASILGFGFSNLALKAGAVLSARQVGTRMTGRLNVNGIGYPISFTRSFLGRP